MGHSEERNDISGAPATEPRSNERGSNEYGSESYNRVTTSPVVEEQGPSDHLAARNAAQDVIEDARGRSKEVAEKAAEQFQETARRFRQRMAGSLGKSKDQLAAQIGSVAQALHRGSEQFRRDDMKEFAEMSEHLAGQVGEVQRYLRDRDSEALLQDVGAFARNRRALFVGSLLVTGVLAARFLNAEGRPETATSPRRTPSRRVSRVRTYSREVRR